MFHFNKFLFSKRAIHWFWVGFTLGLVLIVSYISYAPLYESDEYSFERFNKSNSGQNNMLATARMIKAFADQKMEGKERLVLIYGNSIFRGHGQADESSLSYKIAEQLTNESMGVLNISRDGTFGFLPYMAYEYLSKFYPKITLVTQMGTLMPSPRSYVKKNIEYGYLIYDIYAQHKANSPIVSYMASADNENVKELKMFTFANNWLGILDYGQNLRYTYKQLLYTNVVRDKRVSVFEPINAVKNWEKDLYWHRDNSAYTEKYIANQVDLWKNNHGQRKVDIEKFSEYFSIIDPKIWENTVIIAYGPVPFTRERMGKEGYINLDKNHNDFIDFYRSLGAHVIDSKPLLNDNLHYADMIHWSAVGASVMAGVISSEIMAMYEK